MSTDRSNEDETLADHGRRLCHI